MLASNSGNMFSRRRIWVSVNLVEVIFLEEFTQLGGQKLRTAVTSNFNVEAFGQHVGWL